MVVMTSKRRVLSHGALFVAGCVVATVACSSDDRPPGVGTSSSSSSSGQTSSTSGSSSSSSSSGSGGDGGSSSSSSSAGGPVDSGADTGPTFLCAADTPKTTDAGAALPTSCPGTPCADTCTKAAQNYRVGVAQTAIACLSKLGTCSGAPVINCNVAAIDATCADPTAKTFCTSLVSACDPNAGQPGSVITEEDCERFVSALSATGRTTFRTCLETKTSAGTCAVEADQCFATVQ